jgi:hypothetical protein
VYPVTLHPEPAVEAVQVKVVPELVVDEAANPVGTLGTAEQLPPPPPLPPLEPPPQPGRGSRLTEIIQKRETPNIFLRRVRCEPKPAPINAMPGTMIHAEYNTLPPLTTSRAAWVGTLKLVAAYVAPLAEDDVVENVSVAVATELTATGLGLKLHLGAALPLMTGEMLHERVTVPV